ncbi:hypothetical protein [Salinibacter altiplanensis]|uniref:hypothetical protein n=1 Tax=Salinibacter altiplanensis TaxID=1803181 RepID=UPI001F2C0487|nr:hypothetical protein [Salinibacter altiplanensis]
MSAALAILRFSGRVFDVFEEWWESEEARRMVAGGLVGGFLGALVAIELSRMGWLPEPMGRAVSTNHFKAIDVAFTLFLVVELVGLVVGLATSVADTAGKQFEVFSLILLRRSFKELVEFQEEPIQWGMETGREAVQHLVVDATAALLIFVILGLFYKLQLHQPITESEGEQQFFVRQKKLVANGLLLVLSGLAAYAVLGPLVGEEGIPFFNTFYTVLIFSDILVVLMSLRHSVTYHVVFRNSGFAAATVMIRLALSGPRYLGAALGVGAALFNLGVAAAYYYVAPAAQASTQRNRERKKFEEAPTEPAEADDRSAAGDSTEAQSTPGG